MSPITNRGRQTQGQFAAEVSQESEELDEQATATLSVLNGHNGHRYRWFAPPQRPALSSDLRSTRTVSARGSEATNSTWSAVSSMFGGVASTATSPPTSADYTNTFGTSSNTVLRRLTSGPAPPAVSRFSTSSAELSNFSNPFLPGDVAPVHDKSGFYGFLRAKFIPSTLRKLLLQKWSKQTKAHELNIDHKMHIDKQLEINSKILLGPSPEDRIAMAILASQESDQSILSHDASPEPLIISELSHETTPAETVSASNPLEGPKLLGDAFAPSSSPSCSKQRSSYQSIQSSASHDSTSASTRPHDAHREQFQRAIRVFLPGFGGARWVHTQARFDCQSDDSHISPLALRALGIDVSADLLVSRALQRVGIKTPPYLVVPTSYSAWGAGGIVYAQGKIRLTWKADMGLECHTNTFYVGPDSAPYGVLIGTDFIVPSTGEPRMTLSLPNYRFNKSEEEKKEAKRAGKRHDSDVLENEMDKQSFAASQRANALPGPSSIQSCANCPCQPHQGYTQSPSQARQPSAYSQRFPSAPTYPGYPPSQYATVSPGKPSRQLPLSASVQSQSGNYEHHPISNPQWPQQQTFHPQFYPTPAFHPPHYQAPYPPAHQSYTPSSHDSSEQAAPYNPPQQSRAPSTYSSSTQKDQHPGSQQGPGI